MKKQILTLSIIIGFGMTLYSQAPCGDGKIIINGDEVDAVSFEGNNKQGLKLPLWLETGSSVAAGDRVKLVSVIEFNLEAQSGNPGYSLVFNQVISIGSASQTVPINKIWKVESIVKYSNPFANGISPSSNSPICDGDNLTLNAATVSGATYSWTGPNGFTSSNQNPTVSGASLTASGTYYLTANLSGCSYIDSTVVVVDTLPNSDFTNSYASAGFNVNFTPVILGMPSYSWTFASGSPGTGSGQNGVSMWSSVGNYNVTLLATDGNGCSSSTTKAISVSNCQQNQPQSDFSWGPSIVGNPTVFTPDNTTANAYSWMFDQASPNTSSVQSPNNIVWSNTGTYDVTLETTFNGLGCYITTKQITIQNGVLFTNCGQTGRTGPNQGQCNSEYSGTPLAGNVTVNNGVQQWTVPQTGTYKIEVYGAKGGDATSTYVGGNGAKMQGDFTLTSGTSLNIIVGQIGQNTGYAGGGGASAVWESSNPIIVSGGGGGGNSVTNGNNGYNASTGESGVSSYGAGGVNGFGGVGSTQTQGGAGFFGNGAPVRVSAPIALVNGGDGGNSSSTYFGGFGGGGSGFGGGGGGGGYSGGGGGQYTDSPATASGAGGGSFIAPAATNVATSDGNYNGSSTFNGNPITNLSSYNTGMGYVNIQLVCP